MANLVQNFQALSSVAEEIRLSWDKPIDDEYNQLIPISIASLVGPNQIQLSSPVAAVEAGYLILQAELRPVVTVRGQNISLITLNSNTGLTPGAAYLLVVTNTIIQRRKDAFPVELATGTVYTQNVAVEIFNGSEVVGFGNASVVNGNNIFTDANANYTQDLVGRVFRDSSSYNFTIEAVLSSTQLQLESNDTLHNGPYVILSDFSQSQPLQISPINYAQVSSSVGIITDPNGFLFDATTNTYAVSHQLMNRIVLDANSVPYVIIDNTPTQLIISNTTATPNVSFFPGYTILAAFNGINNNFFYTDNFINSVEADARLGTGLEPNTWYYYTAFTKDIEIGPAGENFATYDSANSTQAYALATGNSDFGSLMYNSYWPEVYRQTDDPTDAAGVPAPSGTGNLQDLMSVFGIQFDQLYSLAETFNLQNARTVSESVLDQFAYQLDLNPTDYIIGRDVLRRIANEMIDIYRNKGDKIGLYKFIRVITTWDITGGTGDINSAINDNPPNFDALRLYSATLGSLNTRIYGSRVIVPSLTTTSYNSGTGLTVVPVTTDLSQVQVGDYLNINTVLYAILGDITYNSVPNGIYDFTNPSATSFTYNSITGVVQYTSSVDLSSVNVQDIFFDGAGAQFQVLAVNVGGYNVTIPTGQTLNLTSGVNAGGSIQQGQKQFLLNAGLSFPLGPASIIRTTPLVNIVPAFTPNSYNAVTGFVSVPNSVNLTDVRIGDYFFDGVGDEFVIQGGIINSPGFKGFTILAGQTVSLAPGAMVNRISQIGSGRFFQQIAGVVVPGFKTFREYLIYVPDIAMFIQTIASITSNAQNQATITFSGIPNFGRTNGLVDCIYYPNDTNVKEFFTIIANTATTITLDGTPQFATVGDTGIILTPLNSARFQRIANLITLVEPFNTRAIFDWTYAINEPI
jgi:hypothetical protein